MVKKWVKWEAVKAFNAFGRRVGRGEGEQGAPRGVVIRVGSLFFLSYNDSSSIMSCLVLKPQFPLLYYDNAQVTWSIGLCLIKFLPTSAACIFVLSVSVAECDLP